MGLFDKVLKTGSDKLDAREGFAGIVLGAVAADGVITTEEALGLSSTFSRMKLFQGMTEKDLRKGLEKLSTIAQNKGADALIQQAAAAVPQDLKTTAFAVAADLLLSDGVVAQTEKTFLEKLQRALGVPEELAVKVVDVVALKNKG